MKNKFKTLSFREHLLVLLLLLLSTTAKPQSPVIDNTFNTGNPAIFSDGTSKEEITDMVVDANGKILLAGYTTYDPDEGINSRGVVIRLMPNGLPDLSFGTAGKVYIDFSNSSDEVYGIDLDNTGNIYLCGRSNYDGAVFKLSSTNGSLNTSFGTSGKAIVPAAIEFTDLKVLPSGKVVAIGWAPYDSSDDDFIIAQFNANGTLDAGFGATGGYSLAGSEDDEYARRLVVQSDGKIAVIGYRTTCSSDNCIDPVIARFLPTGQIDSGFGIGGMYGLSAALYQSEGYDIAIQQSNGEEKILVTGYHEPSNGDGTYGFLLRLRNNGNMDTGFGGSSSGLITFSTTNFTMGGCYLDVQQDNKIVLASSAYYYDGSIFKDKVRMMRRNSDGTLDASFGNGGIFDHQISTYQDVPKDIKSVCH